MPCKECRRFRRNEAVGISYYHTQYRKRCSALRPRLEKVPSKLQYRKHRTCSEGYKLNEVHPRTGHKSPDEKRDSSTLSLTSALDRVRDATPRPNPPPGKTRCPVYRRMGEPQGRCGQVRKISPPPGFDPRTVQPVASRYTD